MGYQIFDQVKNSVRVLGSGSHAPYPINFVAISSHLDLPLTAVSNKIVLQKRKSIGGIAERNYGYY